MIRYNLACIGKSSLKYVKMAIQSRIVSGDNVFTKKCHQWFENNFNTNKCLLTTSCTHALEMASILCDIKEGDEVIMPSYTFVSTANAFVLRGAKIVFVDIRPDTMNIDENLIEAAITKKTKAIVPVHYAGVACEMDKILSLAKKYNLFVIEDAAQAVMSEYKGKKLGTIGDFGCYSFHETKNYTMGEGGALLIRDKKFVERAEVIREKGTNRSKFFRGEIDKYNWVDLGSSYLPSDVNSALLYGQLEDIDKIHQRRMSYWNLYYKQLKILKNKNLVDLPFIPDNCQHNAHIFYIKTKDLLEQQSLIKFLKEQKIYAPFHYIPLHNSDAGKTFGEFCGEDKYTTKESERIVRLPIYDKIGRKNILIVCQMVKQFYNV